MYFEGVPYYLFNCLGEEEFDDLIIKDVIMDIAESMR
jgi:hypothetical protein